MRYGIVSDVHANIQAWQAVLRDMQNEGVDSILCLGDVIGYGPNPAEVLDSCYQHVDYFILGNHDAVVGNRLDSSLFNENAKYLIEWTRDQLNDAAADFFGEMPLRMEGEGFVCAHAELAMPGRFNYIYEAQDAIESFTSNQSPLMFVGHTHFPAKFTYDLGTNLVRKDLCTNSYLLPNERYLINVGSVGDPRDGNTTASYCVYDADTKHLRYRQVEFDVAKFKRNLLKAQLPIQPFFLSVYEGAAKEGRTIKDMEVMESNQAVDIGNSVQRINRNSDEKTSRQKITFSLDDVRSSKKAKEEKRRKRKSESESKKKGLKIFAILLVLLLLSGGAVFLWLKMKAGAQVDPVNLADNDQSVPLNDQPKEKVIIQNDSEDIFLPLDAMTKNEHLKIVNAHLTNWKSDTDKLSWKVRVKQKGWYKVIIDHSKEAGESQIEIKLGSISFAGVLKAASGEQDLGLFENTISGQTNFSLSLASSSESEATLLKSVRLQYLGEEKPFNYELHKRVLGTFESGTYAGWITTGPAFGFEPSSEKNLPNGIEIKGVRGKSFASSIYYGLTQKGQIRTPLFEVKHKNIYMLVSGGQDCFVNLYADGELVETIALSKMERLKKKSFDLKPYAGKMAYLEFVDNGKSFMAFDNVVLMSQDESAYKPGPIQTITGKTQKASENKLNKFLSKAGSKLVKKDFKSCLRDIEEASVVTGTDMSAYMNAVNRISDLEKLFISSFEKDIGKSISIKSKATGGSTQVTVDSVKEDKVFVRVGDSATLTPLKINHISEEGIKERLLETEDGILAYHIHQGSIEDQYKALNYNSRTSIAILLDAALGGLKVSYPKGSIVGSSIEIWAIHKGENAVWNLAVKSSEGDKLYTEPEIVDISTVVKGYKAAKEFKVYKYNLGTERLVKEFAFKNVKGQMKVMNLVLRNTQGKIVWESGYDVSQAENGNLLKRGPIKFYQKFSHPESENLALGKNYTSNAHHEAGYKGVNDGVWSFSPPFIFATDKKDEFPKYVTVDLGVSQKINAIRFGTPNMGSTKNISLQYSQDNNEFVNVMDFDFIQGVADRYTAFFKAVNARYVRIRFNKNYEEKLKKEDVKRAFLAELEVYYFD